MMEKMRYIIILLFGIAVMFPSYSLALTRDQRFEIERRYWYDATDCNNPSSTTGPGVFTGGSNAEIAFNYFVSKGLSKEQAAGIVGNLQAESSIDPRSVQPDGDGRGIAQWDKDDRWINLQNFARGSGQDPLILETQLQFIWFELTGEPPTPGAQGNSENAAYQDLITKTTVRDATISFLDKYERAGVRAPEKRIAFAQQAFDAFSGNSPSGPTGASSAGSCDGNTVDGVGGIDVFPIKDATKQMIQTGVDGATWCYQSTNNCHGTGDEEYNAADIHVPVGQTVQAVKGGTVVDTSDLVNSSLGSNVIIKGEDGAYIYFYTHMAYGLLVGEGAVTTGQALGQVGDSSRAAGTAPHLHFDMLPADKFDTRPGCKRTDCPDDVRNSFINVQPLLVQLYQQLPES